MKFSIKKIFFKKPCVLVYHNFEKYGGECSSIYQVSFELLCILLYAFKNLFVCVCVGGTGFTKQRTISFALNNEDSLGLHHVCP